MNKISLTGIASKYRIPIKILSQVKDLLIFPKPVAKHLRLNKTVLFFDEAEIVKFLNKHSIDKIIEEIKESNSRKKPFIEYGIGGIAPLTHPILKKTQEFYNILR